MSEIEDIWMKLEALAHLRDLPHLGALRAKIEDELRAIDAELRPSKEEPKAIPSAPLNEVPTGDPEPLVTDEAVERRA